VSLGRGKVVGVINYEDKVHPEEATKRCYIVELPNGSTIIQPEDSFGMFVHSDYGTTHVDVYGSDGQKTHKDATLLRSNVYGGPASAFFGCGSGALFGFWGSIAHSGAVGSADVWHTASGIGVSSNDQLKGFVFIVSAVS